MTKPQGGSRNVTYLALNCAVVAAGTMAATQYTLAPLFASGRDNLRPRDVDVAHPLAALRQLPIEGVGRASLWAGRPRRVGRPPVPSWTDAAGSDCRQPTRDHAITRSARCRRPRGRCRQILICFEDGIQFESVRIRITLGSDPKSNPRSGRDPNECSHSLLSLVMSAPIKRQIKRTFWLDAPLRLGCWMRRWTCRIHGDVRGW
jgi:hypothetical protein